MSEQRKPGTSPIMRGAAAPVTRGISAPSVTQIGDLQRRIAENYSIHISKFLDEEIAEVPFLVAGCIPRGCIALLTGESGAGKSFVAYDLARAVATGGSWLNRGIPLAAPENVLILNYDNPSDELKRRIIKLGFPHDANCYIHSQGMTMPVKGAPEMLRIPDEQSKLKYMIMERRPAVIIFDSLRQGQTKDENDNKAMADVWQIYKSWTELDFKPTVIPLHHTSKSSQNNDWSSNARGSGEIISSSDVVIEVRVDKDKNHTLHWTKNRLWEIGQTSSTKFNIVDKYSDGDESVDVDKDIDDEELGMMHTIVTALSPLPGEGERKVVERVVNFIRSRDPLVKVTTLAEIHKEIPMAKTAIVEAVQRARAQRLIKFKHTNNAKGYVLADKP
jgi:RecA-family ATPase